MHFKVGDYFTYKSGSIYMLKRINYNVKGIFSFDLCPVRTWLRDGDRNINSGCIDYYEDITLSYEDIFKNFEKMNRARHGYIIDHIRIINTGQQEEGAAERLFLIERESYIN